MRYETQFNVDGWSKAVKKKLVDKEMTVTKLAKDIGRSRNMVSLVANGTRVSPEIREKINKRLGLNTGDYRDTKNIS